MLKKGEKQKVVKLLSKDAKALGLTLTIRQEGNDVIASVKHNEKQEPMTHAVGRFHRDINVHAAYTTAAAALGLGSKKTVGINVNQQPQAARQGNRRQPMPQCVR